MTQYTSLGVTVSPSLAGPFLGVIAQLVHESPDQLSRTDDGAVTAVWQNRNHFDECGSDDYRRIMDFLNGADANEYSYESISEGYEPIVNGYFGLNFETTTVYRVFGTPIEIGGPVTSRSVKGKLKRRSGTKRRKTSSIRGFGRRAR